MNKLQEEGKWYIIHTHSGSSPHVWIEGLSITGEE